MQLPPDRSGTLFLRHAEGIEFENRHVEEIRVALAKVGIVLSLSTDAISSVEPAFPAIESVDAASGMRFVSWFIRMTDGRLLFWDGYAVSAALLVGDHELGQAVLGQCYMNVDENPDGIACRPVASMRFDSTGIFREMDCFSADLLVARLRLALKLSQLFPNPGP